MTTFSQMVLRQSKTAQKPNHCTLFAATGLGDTAEPSMQLVHTKSEPIKASPVTTPPKPSAEQKPAVPVLQRQAGAQTATTNAQGPAAKKVANGGMSYLDIPAFLRKQAD